MHKSFLFFLVIAHILFIRSTAQTVAAAGNFQNAIRPTIPDSMFVIADTGFVKGGTNRWLLGNHYRKEWLTPVKVPVVLLDTLFGGVRLIKEGGGKQTRSLRLSIDTASGREIVLRSIEKFPDKGLQPQWVGSAVSYFLKDQISTAHPFGAVVVTPLAEAAGIFHTNPKIVFIPASTRLTYYDTLYGNRLYLLEERARTNWSHAASFGYSHQVISTKQLQEKLVRSIYNKVDASAFLRARLLDILIGDWDRHEEQWDWASFQLGEQTVYRPIPKDRDQAFVRLDGIAPWIGTRKWLLRRIKHFDYTIDDLEGLTWQARHLDRLVLPTLQWKDWEREVKFLQEVWTDAVIRAAVSKLPPELYVLSGDEIRDKLHRRCKDLYKYALQFYRFLAKEVRWAGTKDRDEFVVHFQGDTSVVVQQSCLIGGVSLPVKERVFLSKETREIQLYGLDKEDVFRVTGHGKPPLKIRWIGGEGDNIYIDERTVNDKGNIYVYDRVVYTSNSNHSLRVNTRFDSFTHQYRYASFDYNILTPVLFPGYNADDGIYVGGGIKWQKSGWGHQSFAQEHFFAANYAFRTAAYHFGYEGLFRRAIGRWDAVVKGAILHPNHVLNFYGLGNNTIQQTKNRSFYRARVRQATLDIGMKRTFDERHTIQLTANLLSSRVEDWKGRFVSLTNPLLNASDFKTTTWVGASATYTLSKKNNLIFPTKGIHWQSFLHHSYRFNKEDVLLKTGTAISIFLPVWRAVYAFRAGGATLWGRPQFFQYNQLSGLENLRGYRRSRFSGKTMFYNNHEVRIGIANLNGFIARGKLGLLLFSDNGRVWVPHEDSQKWHVGYGGGVWFIPYGKLSITATYAKSREDRLLVVRTGFSF